MRNIKERRYPVEKGDWAIACCRVSSDEQLKNNSLKRQSESVKASAKQLGVYVPKDGIWSGSISSKRGTNVGRRDIAEMLDYCKRHRRVKYLIVDEPDRFMRSIQEAFYYEVEFGKLGVTVWYACDNQLNTGDMTSKMMRFMKYFVAEGSNEERQRKSINGDTTAVLEGRYPSHPKLGYMPGDRPAVHKVEPVIGEFMRSVLNRLSNGLVGLSESLAEFNNLSVVKDGKHCKYQLDKWRKIVTDPYYCGIIEINKQVKARCEQGLHEPLITKEQHERIKEIVFNKKKTQVGPKPGDNPFFPLNKITLCEKCYHEEELRGRIGFKNRGKFVGFRVTNKQNHKYGYYRCRLCGCSIKRDILHKDFTDILDNLEFTEESRENYIEQLKRVWALESSTGEQKLIQLNAQLRQVRKQKNELVDKLGAVSSSYVIAEIERSIERKVEEINDLENQIETISNTDNKGREKFIKFALEFIDNLGANFWSLTPEEVRKFKLLAFPDGFFINEEKIIKIRKISPFLRYKANKKCSPESEKASMVRAKRL